MASAKRSLLVWELWPQCGDGFRFGVYSKQSRPQLERRPQSEPDVGSRHKNRVLQETWGAGWREASGGPLPAPQTEPPFRGLEGSGGVSRAPERKTRKLKKTWWDGVRTETTEREKFHPSPTVDTLYRFVRRSVERMMWRQFNTRLNDNTTNWRWSTVTPQSAVSC